RITARNKEIHRWLPGHKCAARSGSSCGKTGGWIQNEICVVRLAVVARNGSARRQIRILACRYGLQLVQIILSCQMCALAADVRESRHDVWRQLMFHAEVPLLHIRPLHLARNGSGAEWARGSLGA